MVEVRAADRERIVITAKRLGLAGLALISLGASVAYYATMMNVQGYVVPQRVLGYLVLGLVVALAALVLTVFWRSIHRCAGALASQLQRMEQTDQIGLVMVDGADELSQVTDALNRFLTTVRSRVERLRVSNRELELRMRVADTEKHNVEAIILSISDAVLVTNRFDEIIVANQAAEKLLGFRTADSLRKNVAKVLSDGALVRLIQETRSHGRNYTRKVVEHSMDTNGQPRTFSITLSCVVGPQNEVGGVVAVLHDVTREKEIARMKTDFVSNVSHELKTPLASIKAYTEMLLDGEAADEDARREFYEIIASESDRLSRLIENILNISRIESGIVKVVREPMNLTSCVKQVLGVAAAQAQVKDIKLTDNLAPVYAQIEADADMIYQAVMNLVSNAIKYTPPGGAVNVTVAVDEMRKVVTCEVADTGAGISQEELPHVFDKFYRVKANRKMASGTGLGLTLVKHIIETVHDGQLSVTSEEGKGSCFRFELPIIESE